MLAKLLVLRAEQKLSNYARTQSWTYLKVEVFEVFNVILTVFLVLLNVAKEDY